MQTKEVANLCGFVMYCVNVLALDCAAQVQELHRKLSEETRRADNLAFEIKKLEEKHETVMKEKEVRQYFTHNT